MTVKQFFSQNSDELSSENSSLNYKDKLLHTKTNHTGDRSKSQINHLCLAVN